MKAIGSALFVFCLAMSPASAGEKPLTLSSTPGDLHGTLLNAGDPAILMLAGSGPTDRDGNNAMGLRTDMYRMLAQGLAAKGIASLRVDKRGIGESRAAMIAEAALRLQTYAADAAAWAAELRRQTGTKCVWLLGHSEGALVAEIAAEKPDGYCGLILVSGAGRKMSDIIHAQLAANPANPPDLRQAADDIMAALASGRRVNTVPPELAALFRPGVQPYVSSEIALDPAAILARQTLPVLILQGETDIQSSVEDARLLAAAKPGAKLAILPGVNHLLKTAPADRAANIATYGDPTLPLAPGVVDAVADFVHEHSR